MRSQRSNYSSACWEIVSGGFQQVAYRLEADAGHPEASNYWMNFTLINVELHLEMQIAELSS